MALAKLQPCTAYYGENMKMKQLVQVLILAGITVALSSCKTTDEATGSEAAIIPNDFRIEVQFMHPLRWSSRSVEYGYSIEVRNDSIECHLPYMGVAWQADFDNDGLNFRSPITSFRTAPGKKGRTEISFTCNKRLTEYIFHITAYPGGKAIIHLLPSNSEQIEYDGVWEMKSKIR